MRVQSDHWSVILDFAEQYPEIITNKTKSIKGREVLQQSWNELTAMLNSLGFGEKKPEEWKKTIIDWKSKTKAKAVMINTHLGGTGGGPPPNITLTSFEERLLAIMGKVAVKGNPEVKEVGIKRIIPPQAVPEQQPPKKIKLTKPIFLTLNKDQCKPFSTIQSQTFDRKEAIGNKEITLISNNTKKNIFHNLNQTPRVIETEDETSFASQTENNLIPIITAEKPQAQGQFRKSSYNRPVPDTSLCNVTTPVTSQSPLQNNSTTPTLTNKRTSSRRRETELGEQLESMNNSVLEVLQSIDNRLAKVGDYLLELVKVIKDLKK